MPFNNQNLFLSKTHTGGSGEHFWWLSWFRGFIRTELNKDIKALEEALKNPTSQMNQHRANLPPTTPFQARGPGYLSGQQNGFTTPTGSAADYFNPASARPPGLTGVYGGGGTNDFRQPSFTSMAWDNTNAHQTPGGFPSSLDSLGPRVGLQLQGGPPQFLDVNYTEGSSETLYSKSDFPWSRELIVRILSLWRCPIYLLFPYQSRKVFE